MPTGPVHDPGTARVPGAEPGTTPHGAGRRAHTDTAAVITETRCVKSPMTRLHAPRRLAVLELTR